MSTFNQETFLEDLESRKKLLRTIKTENLEFFKKHVPELIFNLIRKTRGAGSIDVDGIYEHKYEYLKYIISFNRRTTQPLHVETNELYFNVINKINEMLNGFDEDVIISFVDSNETKNYNIKNNYELIKKM